MNLFELAFPDDLACIIFDCSENHAAFAKDALVVNRMNVHPGGKQSRMRSTTFVHASQRHLPVEEQTIQTQEMVFLAEHSQFPNQPKGMLQVARERGLLDGLTNQPIQKCKKCPVASDSSTTVKCCLNRILSQEPDFASEISALQKTVINRGHKCLFLPKFHCELNPIECAWGDSKKTCRRECDYSWSSLKTMVPNALDAISIIKIRRWFRLTERFRDAYKQGISGSLADFAVRKYRSHRRLPSGIILEELKKEFEEKKAARISRNASK